MKTDRSIIACLTSLLVIGITVTALAQPTIHLYPDDETPQLRYAAWETHPGIRYELQESTDLENWTPVAGYPSEATALAQQRMLETESGTVRYYRVLVLDEQPPEITGRVPADRAFGVRRISTVQVSLKDASPIDENSISLTVGSHGPFDLTAAEMGFESNNLTLNLGEGVSLGDYGATLEVLLAVADTHGNATNYSWQFELEIEPLTAEHTFIFGSSEALRAGQSLRGPASVLAAHFNGPDRFAASEPGWAIASVASNSITLTYSNSAPDVFAIGQLTANLAPSHVSEIFYRQIDDIIDDPGEKQLTLLTTEVGLADLLTNATYTVSDDSVFLNIDEDGYLTQVLSMEEARHAKSAAPIPGVSIPDRSTELYFDATLKLPTIGTDLSGSTLFTSGPMTLSLDEGYFLFYPSIKVSLETSWGRVQRFEAAAQGDLRIACVPRLVLSSSYAPDPLNKELWSWSHWIWGTAGLIPVGVELKASISAQASVNVSATADMKTGFRQNANMGVSTVYTRNNVPAATWNRWFNISPFESVPFTYTLNGQGQLTLALVPQIDVRVYGLAGIYINTDPRLDLSGSATMSGGTVTEASWLLGAYADINAGLSVIGFDAGELPSLPPFRIFTREWNSSYQAPVVPLTITRQPQPQTARIGDTVTFSVDATSGSSISYQWYQSGHRLPGRTSRQLILSSVNNGHQGNYHVRVSSGGTTINSSSASMSIASGGSTGPGGNYLVVDLSAGPSASSYPVSYLSSVPSGGWTDEYKTTRMVFRRIPAGTFIMGSPSGELGRNDTRETQHQVTLTQDFYIGVFPVTQRQWERVMGDWPSYFNNTTHRNARPVERVSYDMIRGSSAGSGWPANSDVDATSFMGRLRSRTGRAFDLPTESQWEYACRAETTTALNSGKNLTATGSCPNMNQVGRYYYNHPGGYSSSSSVGTEGGTAKVGSYQSNNWGLHDMHGNVYEWCLDWFGTYPGTVTNPKGPSSGSDRVGRGGSWFYIATYCRSAYRSNYYPFHALYYFGFRVALPPGQQ